MGTDLLRRSRQRHFLIANITMTLTFHPVAPQSRIDQDARKRIHKQLQDELAEEAMSRDLVGKRAAHMRDSQQFRLTGERGFNG